MAGLQYRSGSYRIIFRYHGKQQSFTIGQVSKAEAETKASQVDYLLMRLRQRLATIPPGMDILQYLQFDGKAEAPLPTTLTFAQLRDRYLATHEASLEQNTVATTRMHFRHLARHLGEDFPIAELSLSDLQQYVDRRTKADGINGRKLSATTIRKEVVSLRTAWNWGTKMKLVTGRYPNDGLRFPRITEKPPFQTLAEIERQIKAGVTEAEKADLYDSLYLQLHETMELLTHVKATAVHGFVYPLFCMAAHTGARRSELIRMKVTDLDMEGKTVIIHEKKRVKGMATTRRVPMSEYLIAVIEKWLAHHPGGPWLFCHESTVARSRKRSQTTGHRGQKTRAKSGKARKATIKQRNAIPATQLTKDEVNHHVKQVLSGGKWAVIRGLHCLRHSFISACASRGIDQRLVEEFAGHQSPEISRRYRHIFPSTKREAIASVFDTAKNGAEGHLSDTGAIPHG